VKAGGCWPLLVGDEEAVEAAAARGGLEPACKVCQEEVAKRCYEEADRGHPEHNQTESREGPAPCRECVADFRSLKGCEPLLAGDEEGLEHVLVNSSVTEERCGHCEEEAYRSCLADEGRSLPEVCQVCVNNAMDHGGCDALASGDEDRLEEVAHAAGLEPACRACKDPLRRACGERRQKKPEHAGSCGACAGKFAAAGGCPALIGGDAAGVNASIAAAGLGQECEECEADAYDHCIQGTGGDLKTTCHSCATRFLAAKGCGPLLAGDEELVAEAVVKAGLEPACTPCHDHAVEMCQAVGSESA